MNGDDLHDESARLTFWQMYKIPIVLGSISLLLIVISIYLLIKTYQSSDPIQFIAAQDEKVSTASGRVGQELLIDISGAVAKPNVYRLSVGSRVDDAIIAAGGFTPEADGEKIALTINRAAKLIDGAKIYIPSKGAGIAGGVSSLDKNTSSAVHLVSINNASASDLELLSGVGPATSAKIINARPYTRIEELVEKKILSQNLFDTLKSQLSS